MKTETNAKLKNQSIFVPPFLVRSKKRVRLFQSATIFLFVVSALHSESISEATKESHKQTPRDHAADYRKSKLFSAVAKPLHLTGSLHSMLGLDTPKQKRIASSLGASADIGRYALAVEDHVVPATLLSDGNQLIRFHDADGAYPRANQSGLIQRLDRTRALVKLRYMDGLETIEKLGETLNLSPSEISTLQKTFDDSNRLSVNALAAWEATVRWQDHDSLGDDRTAKEPETERRFTMSPEGPPADLNFGLEMSATKGGDYPLQGYNPFHLANDLTLRDLLNPDYKYNIDNVINTHYGTLITWLTGFNHMIAESYKNRRVKRNRYGPYRISTAHELFLTESWLDMAEVYGAGLPGTPFDVHNTLLNKMINMRNAVAGKYAQITIDAIDALKDRFRELDRGLQSIIEQSTAKDQILSEQLERDIEALVRRANSLHFELTNGSHLSEATWLGEYQLAGWHHEVGEALRIANDIAQDNGLDVPGNGVTSNFFRRSHEPIRAYQKETVMKADLKEWTDENSESSQIIDGFLSDISQLDHDLVLALARDVNSVPHAENVRGVISRRMNEWYKWINAYGDVAVNGLLGMERVLSQETDKSDEQKQLLRERSDHLRTVLTSLSHTLETVPRMFTGRMSADWIRIVGEGKKREEKQSFLDAGNAAIRSYCSTGLSTYRVSRMKFALGLRESDYDDDPVKRITAYDEETFSPAMRSLKSTSDQVTKLTDDKVAKITAAGDLDGIKLLSTAGEALPDDPTWEQMIAHYTRRIANDSYPLPYPEKNFLKVIRGASENQINGAITSQEKALAKSEDQAKQEELSQRLLSLHRRQASQSSQDIRAIESLPYKLAGLEAEYRTIVNTIKAHRPHMRRVASQVLKYPDGQRLDGRRHSDVTKLQSKMFRVHASDNTKASPFGDPVFTIKNGDGQWGELLRSAELGLIDIIDVVRKGNESVTTILEEVDTNTVNWGRPTVTVTPEMAHRQEALLHFAKDMIELLDAYTGLVIRENDFGVPVELQRGSRSWLNPQALNQLTMSMNGVQKMFVDVQRKFDRRREDGIKGTDHWRIEVPDIAYHNYLQTKDRPRNTDKREKSVFLSEMVDRVTERSLSKAIERNSATLPPPTTYEELLRQGHQVTEQSVSEAIEDFAFRALTESESSSTTISNAELASDPSAMLVATNLRNILTNGLAQEISEDINRRLSKPVSVIDLESALDRGVGQTLFISKLIAGNETAIDAFTAGLDGISNAISLEKTPETTPLRLARAFIDNTVSKMSDKELKTLAKEAITEGKKERKKYAKRVVAEMNTNDRGQMLGTYDYISRMEEHGNRSRAVYDAESNHQQKLKKHSRSEEESKLSRTQVQDMKRRQSIVDIIETWLDALSSPEAIATKTLELDIDGLARILHGVDWENRTIALELQSVIRNISPHLTPYLVEGIRKSPTPTQREALHKYRIFKGGNASPTVGVIAYALANIAACMRGLDENPFDILVSISLIAKNLGYKLDVHMTAAGSPEIVIRNNPMVNDMQGRPTVNLRYEARYNGSRPEGVHANSVYDLAQTIKKKLKRRF